MRFATLALFLLGGAVMGPPHLHVTPVAGTPAIGAKAFTLEVEHHSRLDQLSVTGRAVTQRNGARTEQLLTVSRMDSTHFTVTRSWDANMPWVLVFAVEQGPNGSHGVVEAIVAVDRTGAVRGIEYTTPGFVDGTREPRRLTRTQVDRTLRALLP